MLHREGSTLFNKQLSEGRAKALVNYLLPRFPFSEELYKVEYGVENWEGLRKMLQGLTWQKRMEFFIL